MILACLSSNSSTSSRRPRSGRYQAVWRTRAYHLVGRVDLGAPVQQQRDGFVVAVLGGGHEAGPALLRGVIRRCERSAVRRNQGRGACLRRRSPVTQHGSESGLYGASEQAIPQPPDSAPALPSVRSRFSCQSAAGRKDHNASAGPAPLRARLRPPPQPTRRVSALGPVPAANVRARLPGKRNCRSQSGGTAPE